MFFAQKIYKRLKIHQDIRSFVYDPTRYEITEVNISEAFADVQDCFHSSTMH